MAITIKKVFADDNPREDWTNPTAKNVGGFIELRRFEKDGTITNVLTEHIHKLPKDCDDPVQYLRNVVHDNDMYHGHEDNMTDHRFFYYMSAPTKSQLVRKLDARLAELRENYPKEQPVEEKEEKEFADMNGNTYMDYFAEMFKLVDKLYELSQRTRGVDEMDRAKYGSQASTIRKKVDELYDMFAEFDAENDEKKADFSAPYIAKTEDGAELNPANKGEHMFSISTYNNDTAKMRTFSVLASDINEAKAKACKRISKDEFITRVRCAK